VSNTVLEVCSAKAEAIHYIVLFHAANSLMLTVLINHWLTN